jgi:CDP-diacylglycerol--serine O-phosphatidyltransferase
MNINSIIIFFKKYAIIPNAITLCNLLLGLSAIVLSLQISSYFPLNSLSLIVIATLFDRFDGAIARKLNQVTEFGKQMDSLTDIVSFGIAPIIITCQIYHSHELFTYFALSIYLVAGVLRLARFHVNDEQFFIGLPITIAALIVSLKLMIDYIFRINATSLMILQNETIILFLILSFFMISPFKFKKM